LTAKAGYPTKHINKNDLYEYFEKHENIIYVFITIYTFNIIMTYHLIVSKSYRKNIFIYSFL